GANANWTNTANWNPASAPANGDTLVFPAGQPRLLNTNNLNGLVLNQIAFSGAAGGSNLYNIYGNSFILTNSIQATNHANNWIYNDIALSNSLGVGSIVINVGTNNTLLLLGMLSGNIGVNMTGGGSLYYYGRSNSYSGTTTIEAGNLTFGVTNA